MKVEEGAFGLHPVVEEGVAVQQHRFGVALVGDVAGGDHTAGDDRFPDVGDADNVAPAAVAVAGVVALPVAVE
jgi:hypothetical protein